MTVIIGIQVSDRENSSSKLQEILTSYGCFIKTRLGLHNTSSETCYPNGIILLELTDKSKADNLISELNKAGGFRTQKMTFE